MNAGPGEPNHETQGYEHRMCVGCWQKRRGGRLSSRNMSDTLAPCCFCDAFTGAGIYIRAAPSEVHKVKA